MPQAPPARNGVPLGGWSGRIPRTRWTLPVMIILVIVVVVVVDRIDAHRIPPVEPPRTNPLTAVSAGAIHADLPGPWDGFNPHDAVGAASTTPELLAGVLPSAFTVNAKWQPVLNTDLLTQVELIGTDPQTVRYDLNPAAEWSDGVKVSPDDFVYAWRSGRGVFRDTGGEARPASTAGYDDISSVTASPDGGSVTVVFKAPYADWRLLFSEMLPAHVMARTGFESGLQTFDPRTVISAGPMLVTSASGSSVTLGRNPRWWGAVPKVSSVVVGVAATGADAVDALGSGPRVVVERGDFTTAQLARLGSMRSVASSAVAGSEFSELVFDTAAGPTSALAVRQGVALLLDRAAIASAVVPTDPMVTLDDDFLDPPKSPANVTVGAAGPYEAPDPARAQAAFASAGYVRKGSRARIESPEGTPLQLRLAVDPGSQVSRSIGTMVASELQAAGISVSTVDVTPAELPGAVAGHLFDLAVVTRQASPFVSTTEGWYTTSPSAGALDQANWSGTPDRALPALYTQLEGVLNPSLATPVLESINTELWQQLPALPLVARANVLASTAMVAGVTQDPVGLGFMQSIGSWVPLAPRVGATVGSD